MLVVNFFGGPDSGKSTMAAAVYSQLKFQEINCECVQEYAKDKVWEESYGVLKDQIYVFAKQQHRLKRLDGKIDIALMDSPLLLSAIYDATKNHLFHRLILQEFEKYTNLNYFLQRHTQYHPVGRVHSEEQALQKDNEILALLENHHIPFTVLNSGEASVQKIIKIIKPLSSTG